MNWKPYRKLVAVVAGFGVLFVVKQYDLYLPGVSELVMELSIGALTSFGVYQAPNDPA